MTDTIYALATPYGRAGVAVVRVSGARALDGLAALTGSAAYRPRQTSVRTLVSPATRETIDQAMVIYFEGPASYTGEDVVEYHVHGGIAVIESLLSGLSALDGHRMALPGEFTRRAFENGRMDLTAAEAVADLIDAETQAQKEQALAQMDGALSRLYEGWRDRLTRILAYMEVEIDFTDEDVPEGLAQKVMPDVQALRQEIEAHLNDNRRGERLRHGIRVAVIGAPNAGKSSLVNALAQREIAIVSPMAGTTRDVIEAHLDLGGYPVILADTAGLRPEQLSGDGHDAIESEGIKRAMKQAADADIRLLLFDGTAEPDKATGALADHDSLIVCNKSDRHAEHSEGSLSPTPELSGILRCAQDDIVFISAKTGQGLDRLTARLAEKIKTLLGKRSGPSPTRARHREALESCVANLLRAESAPVTELVAEDLRLAIRALGQITGRVDVEDLLDVIFRDFCIGK